MATEKRVVKGDQYESIDGKLFEIKRQLREKSGYPYDAERLDNDLQKLVEGRFRKPFNMSNWAMTPIQQLDLAYGRNYTRTWGFKEVDFEHAYHEMKSQSVQKYAFPFITKVLDVVFDSPKETFIEAWHCIKNIYCIRTILEFDPDGIKEWGDRPTKKGLYWRTVNFAAHRDDFYIRDKDFLRRPSSSIFWAASYCSGWIRAMDAKEVPYVLIPGYTYYEKVKNETPDYRSGQKFLGISFSQKENCLNLICSTGNTTSHGWATPIYVDE